MKRFSSNRSQTGLAMILVALVLGGYVFSLQRAGQQINDLGPGVRYNDETPLGGKGLRLLMERLGYSTKRVNIRLSTIPVDARVWLVLNGQTTFSRNEANLLMQWVRDGGTLVMAVPPTGFRFSLEDDESPLTGIDSLCAQVGARRNYMGPLPTDPNNGLPRLQTLPPASASVFWSGVSRATASRNQLNLTQPRVASDIEATPTPSIPLSSSIPSGTVSPTGTLAPFATPAPSGTSTPSGTPAPAVTPTPKGAPFSLLGTSSQEGDEASIETLEIAGTPVGPVVVQRRFGRGRVVLLPDPLLFSNYGLNHDDNAVFATNLLRYSTFLNAPSVPGSPSTSKGTVYFDERDHSEPDALAAAPQDFTRYLRVPAVRAALLQLLGAVLLAWLLFGTRLGAAVALPESEPVTRASNFARAMGALFHKAGRSRTSSAILASEFRRLVARRVGLATGDDAELIASRVAQAADVPHPLVLRLLRTAASVPVETSVGFLDQAPQIVDRIVKGDPETGNEESLVRDAQEMEDILRRLGIRR